MKSLYSLWIVPPSNIKRPIENIILQLSNKCQSPRFEPHMTLLGDVGFDEKTVIQKTKKLALKIKPFMLTLGETSFSTTEFQSVFIRVKSTAELMEANLRAQEIFQVNNNVFMPHISLLYGNHKMKMREKIASEIQLPNKFSFKAEKIIVVPSTRNPSEWKHLAEISL